MTRITDPRWLREYLDRESGNGKARESYWDDPSGAGSTGDLRPPGALGGVGGIDVNVPLLVVGTKHDLAVAAASSLPMHQGRTRTPVSVPKCTPELGRPYLGVLCLFGGQISFLFTTSPKFIFSLIFERNRFKV